MTKINPNLLIGHTIKHIDHKAINSWTITLENDAVITLYAEPEVLGIPVLYCEVGGNPKAFVFSNSNFCCSICNENMSAIEVLQHECKVNDKDRMERVENLAASLCIYGDFKPADAVSKAIQVLKEHKQDMNFTDSQLAHIISTLIARVF